MIHGIGTDLAKISRFADWLDSGKAERFFHPSEYEWVKSHPASAPEKLAARFAAKEAFGKALGSGLRGICLSDIEVRRKDGHRPEMVLHGSALRASAFLGSFRIHLSLGHEGEYAIASVCIECEGVGYEPGQN